MADKENKEDEYEFDAFDIEPEGAHDVYSTPDEEVNKEFNKREDLPPLNAPRRSANPVMRNSLIVLGLLALVVIGYSLVSGFLTKKTTTPRVTQKAQPTQKPLEVIKPAPETIIQQQPIKSDVELSDKSQKRIDDQLQALENNQKNLESQVSSMQNELSSVSTTISALTKQIENLNQTVLTLSDKVADESIKLTALSVCAPKPKKVVIVPKVKKVVLVPRVFYHLKAIIPGRAWLIGTNGSTITVRDGSIVPGFGVVKLIDAIQGRVLMQSGQVIEFSQQDS